MLLSTLTQNLERSLPHEKCSTSVCRMNEQLPSRSIRTFETGWDLGPITAVLAPGRMPPQETKCKETMMY